MNRKEVKGIPRMHIRMPNGNVLMYGIIESVISQVELEKAIILLADKHALLNTYLKTDKDGKVWFMFDRKLSPKIHIRSSTPLNEIINEELKHCFDFERGPLIRFVLVHGKKTTLILNCHHSICDGLSLVQLLKDILGVLSGNTQDIEKKAPVFLEQDNIPQKLGDPISRMVIQLINRKWSRASAQFTKENYQKWHTDFWKRYKPYIVMFDFTEKETHNIITQCKVNNVSVNTGLVTAFLSAEDELFEHKDYSGKVIVTGNLRKALIESPGDTMGFFISNVKPELHYNQKITFWENARNFHKIITSLLKKSLLKSQKINLLSPEFLDVMMLNYAGFREDKQVQKLIKSSGLNSISSTFTIANLGNIQMGSKTDNFMVEGLYGPFAVSEGMEKYISVVTANKTMRVSICFNENTLEKESIHKIKEIVLQQFRNNFEVGES